MSLPVEERLRALEDRAAIAELIAQYGPAVDRGDADAVRALWSDDGEYGFDDTVLDAEGIHSLVDLETHRDLMRRGCAHIISAPTIVLGGDAAVAITHSAVLAGTDRGWEPARVSANRWELVRTAQGWKVNRRLNRLLDGSAVARNLLAPGGLNPRTD
ncbi:nuclear transport factor 2 family protein [Microbacterium sp. NIBRBAC000506063]|uniref:nuclear transport factor 2 family protein n=1 Tax=Microbacterium sp. NIBRBAC000506063 TaxID=2734618 RepID=UPI001BB50424|nr:nuclear transport factor 2 family protein [Microbacterium sp. NIBRBAC000506063]QTV79048.1 nuclear transport factor 2 family protein [Microbacterium sp. NIBRBAC000506063]